MFKIFSGKGFFKNSNCFKKYYIHIGLGYGIKIYVANVKQDALQISETALQVLRLADVAKN